jgi:pyruvate kinase
MTFALPLARALLVDLARLRAEVADEGATTLALWARSLRRPEFEPAALNLAHYLSFRRRDVLALQGRLSQLGLSSLGQSESRVLPALDEILATLAVLAGQRPVATGVTRVRQRGHAGHAAIVREQMRIFGPDPHGPRTRIMVTMPAGAATDPALVARMLAAGADCARINCAHDGPDVWRAIIRQVRVAAKAAGRRCAILMDLAGPKVRVTAVTPSGKVRLVRGDRFELATAPARALGARVQATVSHAEIIAALTPGALIWIDDGKIGARVVSVTAGRAVVEVIHARDRGERLRPEKGINLPSVDLAIAPLTAKDLVDLDFVATHADCVGYSFVQRPSDVTRLQRELSRRRPGRPLLPVILKIETSLAVRNLPRLIVAAGGRQPVAVMIARGDLAVEIGLARLSEIQEQILWICEAAHVPVVWATQVLERLVKDGAASRGEATDAAMGQRAECVMLNKGPHQVEAIKFLDDVLRRMDRHQHKRAPRLGPLGSWTESQTL